MVPYDPVAPGHALFTHVRRHRWLILSAVLHAALLPVLAHLVHPASPIELARQERAIATGSRLTQQARLEKRVHDMERIKSLLDTGARDKADDVQFSAQPRSPEELLKKASELAQTIDQIQQGAKAEQLAKLLAIPKEQALAQLATETPKPDASKPADPAAQIEQLEAKARQVLEQRRQELERQQNGASVTASANVPHPGGLTDNGKPNGTGAPGQKPDGAGTGRTSTGAALAGSALSKIAAFTNPDLPDRASQAYVTGSLSLFNDSNTGTIPDADFGTMVKGAGRMIGAGGEFANRIYVNSWYLIGPFDGRHGQGLFANVRHPPEDGVVLDAAYRGKDDRLLKWEYVDMASYPYTPPDAAEDAVYYGYTELMMDADRDLTIWVGADDDAQLWLNDRLVWKGGDIHKQWFFAEIYNSPHTHVRDWNLSEGKRVVHFRKGRNKLFFKLSNGPTRLFFSLVLT